MFGRHIICMANTRCELSYTRVNRLIYTSNMGRDNIGLRIYQGQNLTTIHFDIAMIYSRLAIVGVVLKLFIELQLSEGITSMPI